MTIPPPTSPPSSPSWGQTTKLVVGLTIVGIVAALLITFRSFIGPLILAFVLTYLVSPLAANFSKSSNLSWRASVNVIYLVLVILVMGILTATGVALVQQIQSLIELVNRFITELPALVADLSHRVFTFGPFQLDFAQLNLGELTNQLLGAVQPLLGRVGTLVSTLATGTASVVGWLLFVLLISYFILAEAGRQVPDALVRVDVPGYNADIRRLTSELSRIWSAFLRGQILIITLVVITYTVLMFVMGVRYGFAIAILAGLARFVPYLGPFTAWTVTLLVAFFQGTTRFGLAPLQYAILVIILAIIIDQIFDNLVVPRLLGRSLGVHPAAVLIAALVATRMIGIIGLVLAAPVLATLQLLGRYMVRKLFDLDPWPVTEVTATPIELPWSRGARRLKAWMRLVQKPPEK